MSRRRMPYAATYQGGPADGRTETIQPAPGEAIDVRHVPVPPTPSLAIADATTDFNGPTVAVYHLVSGAWITLTEREAFLRDLPAGRNLVRAIYEFRSMT